jgi:hypothetical protein
MKKMFDPEKVLTVSLILYNNSRQEVLCIFDDLLNSSLPLSVYIRDHSPRPLNIKIPVNLNCYYVHDPSNPGFGRGHNLTLQTFRSLNTDYYLLLNPDIRLNKGALERLCKYMDDHMHVSAVMPAVFSPDGCLQLLAKMLPRPEQLIARRFLPQNSRLQQRLTKRYEVPAIAYKQPLWAPCLSGCCLLVRRSCWEAERGFDPRFFLYMEDFDLCRRLNRHGPTMVEPGAAVTHSHGRASYRWGKPLFWHMCSAWKYFQKWGWWRDVQRRQLNMEALAKLPMESTINS